MKVLVLDGSADANDKTRAVCDILDEVLTERKVHHEVVHLADRRIVPCTGCMDCWVLSPGKCSIDDDACAIMRSWMSSNVVVLLSRMTFGGYSSGVKDMLDRQLGLLTPYLVAEKGTVEHRPRYDRYPSLLGIAVCDELKQCDSDTFRNLVRSNGRTLRSHHSKALVVWSNEDRENLKDLIDSAVMGMKVVP